MQASSQSADESANRLGAALARFRNVPGSLGYELMRGTDGDETLFVVVTYWDSMERARAVAAERAVRGMRARIENPSPAGQVQDTLLLEVIVEESRPPRWAAWRAGRCMMPRREEGG